MECMISVSSVKLRSDFCEWLSSYFMTTEIKQLQRDTHSKSTVGDICGSSPDGSLPIDLP